MPGTTTTEDKDRDITEVRASIVFTQIAHRADVQLRADDFITDLDRRCSALTGLALHDYFAAGLAIGSWFRSGALDPVCVT